MPAAAPPPPRGRLRLSTSDAPLLAFVTHRLRDRAEMAAEGQDLLNHRFILWEIEWIERAWRHGTAHPAGRVDVARYLKQVAYRYRRHPDFDVSWRGSGAPSPVRDEAPTY